MKLNKYTARGEMELYKILCNAFKKAAGDIYLILLKILYSEISLAYLVSNFSEQ